MPSDENRQPSPTLLESTLGRRPRDLVDNALQLGPRKKAYAERVRIYWVTSLDWLIFNLQILSRPTSPPRAPFWSNDSCFMSCSCCYQQRFGHRGWTYWGGTGGGTSRWVRVTAYSHRTCIHIELNSLKSEYQIFKQLLQLSPGIQDRIYSGSEEDIIHIADLVSTRLHAFSNEYLNFK